MKAITRLQKILMIIVLTITLPIQINAMVTDTIPNNTEKIESINAKKMIERLEEIKKIDKSDMSRAEKKSLRKEVREIKKTLKASNNGVYLSVGAIIIIVLLLILLL